MSHGRVPAAALALALLIAGSHGTLSAQTTGQAPAGQVGGAAQPQVTVEVEVATQVLERMPVGSGSQFAPDVGQLYCWTLVTGAEDSTIQHVWIYGGQEFPVPLQVGGSPWRTWSTKVIPPEWTGEWRVEIRDASGTVLDAIGFQVG